MDLVATNRFGVFRGRIDYGAHLEVFRFRNLAAMGAESGLLPANLVLSSTERARSYYFEVRCAGLKILNDERVQYARFSGDDPVRAQIMTYPRAWQDFRESYGIAYVRLYKVDLEELGSIPIDSIALVER